MLRLVNRLLAPALIAAALVAVPWASAQAHHPHGGPGGFGYHGGYGAGYPGYGIGYGGYGGHGYPMARPHGYFPYQAGPFGRYPTYYRMPGAGFYGGVGPGGFGFGYSGYGW